MFTDYSYTVFVHLVGQVGTIWKPLGVMMSDAEISYVFMFYFIMPIHCHCHTQMEENRRFSWYDKMIFFKNTLILMICLSTFGFEKWYRKPFIKFDYKWYYINDTMSFAYGYKKARQSGDMRKSLWYDIFSKVVVLG